MTRSFTKLTQDACKLHGPHIFKLKEIPYVSCIYLLSGNTHLGLVMWPLGPKIAVGKFCGILIVIDALLKYTTVVSFIVHSLYMALTCLQF